MANIRHAIAHAGGWAFCDSKLVKVMDSSDNVTDLRLPTSYNGKAIQAIKLESHGRFLGCWVCYDDYTDLQLWEYFNAAWHAYSPVLSKVPITLALQPLFWGASEVGSNQRRSYCLYPATTNTAACRNFVPVNLLDDPLQSNTTEVKQDGTLALRTPDLVLGGGPEANKVFHSVQYTGRQISAVGGTYGTLRIELETGGVTAFTSPAVDTGANVLDSAFELYNVPSSGVAFKTVMIRVTLNNAGSSSAKTANGLPFVITMSVVHPLLRLWDVFVDRSRLAQKEGDWTTFLARFITLSNTKAAQRLKIGKLDVPAVVYGFDAQLIPKTLGVPPDVWGDEAPVLTFLEKPGVV